MFPSLWDAKTEIQIITIIVFLVLSCYYFIVKTYENLTEE